jgi:Tfp pilus assembly protein PilF
MEKAQPKIGYALLAQILNKTQHKFVITTNFDYLMEDALRFYTDTHPLVCGHESLAPYISLHSSRPVIMKVHRDLLLEPLNKREEVVLKKQWKKVIKLIAENYSLIVLGYGGNDTSSDKQGLMDYLTAIKKRKPIYWCYRKDDYPNQRVINLLKYHKYDCLVEIEDFDRFITQLAHNILESEIIYFKYPNESFIVKNATDKAEKYLQEFNNFLGDTIDNDKYDKHQWAWLWRIKVDAETDKNEKRRIYQKAINILPSDINLLLNYVSFLIDENDINEADSYIRQALKIEPNNANTILFYALFLHESKNENFKEVQPYYLRTLELKPNDTAFNYYYAEFLKYHEHYTEAEHHYLKTLELDANHLNANNSYSLFLHITLKNYDKAEIYYLKYLQLEPNDENINGNYAQLLLIKGKKEQAESHLTIALISDNKDLLLECWFYRLAHFAEYKQQALQKIENLLNDGVHSIGWDFSANIEQAEREGYSDIEQLKTLAQRITTE